LRYYERTWRLTCSKTPGPLFAWIQLVLSISRLLITNLKIIKTQISKGRSGEKGDKASGYVHIAAAHGLARGFEFNITTCKL
jgi:hypothetical protein